MKKLFLIPVLILIAGIFWSNLRVIEVGAITLLFFGTSYGNMRKEIKTPLQDISSILSLLLGCVIFITESDMLLKVIFAIACFASATIFVVRQKNTLTEYQKKYGPLEKS